METITCQLMAPALKSRRSSLLKIMVLFRMLRYLMLREAMTVGLYRNPNFTIAHNSLPACLAERGGGGGIW